MEDNSLRTPLQWLKNISKGNTTSKLEAITMEGLQIVDAKKGFIRCNFIVPSLATGSDGNWHVGAIATLIDCVGAAAIFSIAGHIKVSLDFTISYYSTAKIQEEVEIEAKVAGNRGSLSSFLVEVKKKKNGQLIALGKQWMAASRTSKL